MIASDWAGVRRLLCVRLDNLGDVLMTTPAIRALRASLPGVHVTLLGSASGCAAAAHIAEIDDAIAYAAPWVANSAGADDDEAIIGTLRRGRFDAAVIFTVFSQSALPAAMLCRQAGIALRLAHCRENPYRLLTHWLAETEPQQGIRHEVQRQLDLAASVGANTLDTRLSFRTSAADRHAAQQKLRRLIADPQRWLLIHPGATAASRRYPVELFAQAATSIARRLRCDIVFGGTADERDIVDAVREAMPLSAGSLAGELSLGECAALIEAAPVLLSNNSGPVHLAAALGTPVVDVYALTNPQHTPWQVPNRVLFHDVPCRNCFKSQCPQGHHDCLRRVDPQTVADAVVELFTAHAAQATVPAPITERYLETLA
jgi:lipopolysaccharide heptosyltransferase II